MPNRLIVLAALAGLSLAGCGKKGGDDVTANADTGLTAESIGSNDVTAIDAVTGEAANMAADVVYAPANNATVASGNASADRNEAGSSAPRPRPSRPVTRDESQVPPVTSEPAQPAGNNSTE